MKLFDLTGRVAVVTGGNAGIGFGMAQGLAAAGATIVIAGRRNDKNREAAQAMESFNVKTAAVEVDVCEEASCRGLVEATVEQFSRLDILVKNGGGGKIINTGSMLSIFGASFAAAYAASKGGIVQMTKALACAWAKDNIQVNAILPGWIDTPLTQSARREVPGLNERVLARTPAGRWGKPDDFAGIAVFLASPASDFITGAAIPVDGGYSSQV